MDKRRRKRFARRLQVQYWPHGDEQPRKGYTTNVSTTGVFVATNAPIAPGKRLRLEFLGDKGFVIEAVVAHAARVSASLQSIRSSGMGIRFLSPSELLRDLLPPGGTEVTESAVESERRKEVEAAQTRAERIYQRAEEAGKKSKHRAATARGAPIYTVGFRNVAYLLDAIESEIHFGGIFVPTESPAGLQEDVRIALALPAPIKRTVHAEARVVTLSDTSKEGTESTVDGMGVAFKEPAKVLAELERLIASARPRPPAEG